MKDLFKNRSTTACMKSSYNLITNHLGSLLKKTWWAVFSYAIVATFCCYLRLPNKELHDWGVESPMAAFVIQSVASALAFITSILAGASLWQWLNNRSLWWNLKRYLAINLLIDILLCVFVLAVMFTEHTFSNTVAKVGIPLVIVVLAIIITLPFGYVLPRLMLLGKGEKLKPWKSFATGLRHSGSILMLGFLSSLIIGIIACVLFIPAGILGGAQTIANLGALEGDPLGMPSYFTPLLMVVMTALLFVFFYVGSWLTISYAYLYGSYVTQDAEKREQTENKQITSYQQ